MNQKEIERAIEAISGLECQKGCEYCHINQECWQPMKRDEVVGIALACMELQVAKKPIYKGYDNRGSLFYARKCPACDILVGQGKNNCYDCGQRILWEDE